MIETKKYFAEIVERSKVLKILEPFRPLWVGTIPIEVHIESSDIDIICELEDDLPNLIRSEFGQAENFTIKESDENLVAQFRFMNVPFEIYAERLEPSKQLGYLHMIAEAKLLNIHGETLRERVRALKRHGFKTEPAFAEALGIEGDPYKELLKFVNV